MPAPGFARKVSSLCTLCVLCVSVVNDCLGKTTTKAQRTQRLHREHSTHSYCPSRNQFRIKELGVAIGRLSVEKIAAEVFEVRFPGVDAKLEPFDNVLRRYTALNLSREQHRHLFDVFNLEGEVSGEVFYVRRRI